MNINISNYIDFKELLFDLYLSDSKNILNDESLTDLVYLYSLGKDELTLINSLSQVSDYEIIFMVDYIDRYEVIYDRLYGKFTDIKKYVN